MNDNPMTEQVAKLVGNLLAGGGRILLPGVGSLYVERRPARRLDRRHLLPPCRTVQFSSQECGTSLVEEIARVLRVNGVKPEDPMPEARKVYDRWLAQVREGDTLVIAGVGVLRFKDFKLDEAFDRRLNPKGHEPVLVRAPRRFDAVLWIGIVAIVCVLGGVMWWWYGERARQAESQIAATERMVSHPAPTQLSGGDATDSLRQASGASGTLHETTSEAAMDATSGTVAGTAFQTSSESVAETASGTTSETASGSSSETTVGTARTTAQTGVTALVSGRNYVVMGVFSTESNARRAAHEALTKEATMNCGIYRFGTKYMVSPFESDDPETCRLFIRAHADQFPGMWTYTAR